MVKYLDLSGLSYFWSKLKNIFVKSADLATVATSGDYNDLSNKPTVNDGTLTIQGENGGAGILWRTPASAEWDYIINTRNGNRFAKCQIDSSINALIIFPDNYTTSLSGVNNVYAAFTSNQLTIQDAESLTNDGCVILSIGGYRDGYTVAGAGINAFYWSSTTPNGSVNARYLGFDSGSVEVINSKRFYGFSVRLITDSSDGIGTFTINANGDTCLFASGNLQYKASTNEWRFAERQWDYIGQDNENISSSYDGWIDLFGYGTSGVDNNQNDFEPYSTSATSTDYYDGNLYDSPNNSADWGYAYSQQHQGNSYRFTANQSGDTTITLSEAAFTGKSSDLNNDAGFITQNEVLTYKAIPNDWNTNSTMEALIADIDADENAVKGMSYLGTVSLTDLPAGMMQAEMVINIMANEAGLGKNITFTVTSSNTAPYHWEYTSAYSSLGTWRSFGDTEWDVYEGSN